MAHILNDNYSILSISTSPIPSEADLKEKLGDLNIRRGAALPLLWAYLWSSEERDFDIGRKGKGRERISEWEERLLSSGQQEQSSDLSLVCSTLSILALAAQTSTANLFSIRTHLPELPDFLLTRLYGYPLKRKYATTIPPRDDWCDDLPEDDIELEQELPWLAPCREVRAVYLNLLRRLLEGGVDQSVVWRLFSLAKVQADALTGEQSTLTTGQNSPLPSSGVSSPMLEDSAATLSKPKSGKKRKPGLHISTTIKGPDVERLQPEILELIRQSLKTRWPPAFVLKGGSGGNEGGLELPDMGRAWPIGAKGFNFSVSRLVSLRFI